MGPWAGLRGSPPNGCVWEQQVFALICPSGELSPRVRPPSPTGLASLTSGQGSVPLPVAPVTLGRLEATESTQQSDPQQCSLLLF